MTIKLYDSMARAKRPFEPLDPNNVRMYVCGPTVYDRAHIGNARPAVVFDVLFRLLRREYGAEHVTYVRNITDIDDKIIARAHERGVPIDTVTQETARWFQDDMAALGCLSPTHQPRATEYVAQMVAMIARLIAEGKAYAADGHVLFEVAKFPDYGRLSGRSTDAMIAGARVEVAPYKRDPMDFVLWKPSDAAQPGWDSPWGRGRPGWHIECSAMARALLGESFDIHGGGADLMFPHHENEIAQSVCAHPGEGFARWWMHNDMVVVDGQKMSKSLGNFYTVSEVVEKYRAEHDIDNFGFAVRFRLLMSHYRGKIDAGFGYLEEAAIKLNSYRHALETWTCAEMQHPQQALDESGVVEALSDDLNTPEAIVVLDALVSEIRGQIVPPLSASGEVPQMPSSWTSSPTAQDKLAAALGFLGFPIGALNSFDPNLRNRRRLERLQADEARFRRIKALFEKRAEARADRNFARADAIRKALDAAGVIVMDRPDAPTEWELGPNFDPAKLDGIDA